MSSIRPLLPSPRRITASNLPISHSSGDGDNAEPVVEVIEESLEVEAILGGLLARSRVATIKKIPTSNDGAGYMPLDEVPGMGIVMPNGLNMYYLDVAPNSEGTMHRTTSCDYLVVLQGTLTLLTPAHDWTQEAGYGKPKETLCHPGEVVIQRGMMHALSNRTDEWIRLFAVVVASEPNKVPVEHRSSSPGQEEFKVLDDAWLA
ncbi:hypothetical protein F5Y17DRAFT_329709 [Xylariaceae sp. FL0594]|nr:hypothetical protein F5Y17DRAFT_329709 [Xylariaceae sp. FL0594]